MSRENKESLILISARQGLFKVQLLRHWLCVTHGLVTPRDTYSCKFYRLFYGGAVRIPQAIENNVRCFIIPLPVGAPFSCEGHQSARLLMATRCPEVQGGAHACVGRIFDEVKSTSRICQRDLLGGWPAVMQHMQLACSHNVLQPSCSSF